MFLSLWSLPFHIKDLITITGGAVNLSHLATTTVGRSGIIQPSILYKNKVTQVNEPAVGNSVITETISENSSNSNNSKDKSKKKDAKKKNIKWPIKVGDASQDTVKET